MHDELLLRVSSYQPVRLEDDGLPRAAVLIAIYQKDGTPHVLFTARTELVEHHKWQVSFPGGAQDPDDADLVGTALRETDEEIGVSPEHVEVVGQLDDILTISDFVVTPYVGRITAPAPYPFVPNEFEVAEILEVPLSSLYDPANIATEPVPWRDRLVPPPAYRFQHHLIWGATARVLRQFLELVGE